MYIKTLLSAFFFSAYLSQPLMAQFSLPGQIDTTFDFGGASQSFLSRAFNPQPGGGANSTTQAISLQPDGKIIIGGLFSTYNGAGRNCIARINQDGNLDTSFNPGAGANFTILALTQQPDGKIFIGGSFTTYDGIARNYLARIHHNGSLDTTFNTGSGPNNVVRSLVLQPDGKLLIGGEFTSVNGVARNFIARLNTDGSVDSTFNSGSSGWVYAIAIQPDGRILIGGTFTNYNGFSRSRIARINANGSLDTTFNPGTGLTGASSFFVKSLARQQNGQILIGGTFAAFNGTSRANLARLNSDGSLDTSFNTGTSTNGEVQALAIQTDGKILIGGNFTSYNGVLSTRIARINFDGSLDTSFSSSIGANGPVFNITLRPDGKMYLGGSFTNYNGRNNNRIARVETNGSQDGSFNPITGTNSIMFSLALQPDGKIIIAGTFTAVNGVSRFRIARMNADGSLDHNFNPGSSTDGSINAVLVQPDGKVLVGGYFYTHNGINRLGVSRMNADGSLDTTFSPVATIHPVHYLGYQPDGKVLIGGSSTAFDNIAYRSIVRLNPNGSRDSTFNQGTGSGGTNAIILQPDNKILMAGSYSIVNGVSRRGIARLNANSSLDTTFNPGTGFIGTVNAIALQSDGKVCAGGAFTSFNGVARNRITRLNANGTLDATFNPGTGANGSISSVIIQPDGKIIIAGNFTAYNGTAINRIARLNDDGSLDATFNPGTGANNIIHTSALQPDGKVLIGGLFTDYDGGHHLTIARVNSPICLTLPSAPSVLSPVTVCSDTSITITPTGGGNYRFYNTAVGGNPVAGGDGVSSFTTPILNATTTYHVASVTANGCESSARTAITITVNARPSAPVVNPQISICAGANAIISPISGGARYRFYTDSVGGSPIPGGESVNTLSIPFLTTTTTYYIASLSTQGCESNTRTVVTVNVNPLPLVQIAQMGDSLFATTNPGNFQWLLNGVAIAGATDMHFKPLLSGEYTLSVTSPEGCIGLSNAVNFIATGLEFGHVSAAPNWSAYPVPFADKLTIEAENAFSYVLIDSRGVIVKRGMTETSQVTLHTEDLQTGLYLVKINIYGQTHVRKLIRE